MEIGVARYVVADREECAEIAVAVADAWQRQGVGERLLGGLIQVAARRSLRWLEGEVLVRWKSTMNCGNEVDPKDLAAEAVATTIGPVWSVRYYEDQAERIWTHLERPA